MIEKRLLMVAGITVICFGGSCKDQELRDWLENYTEQEKVSFEKINERFENHRIRLCQLEEQDPCPPDNGSVPTPPKYP